MVATTACTARLAGTSCDVATEDASHAVAEGLRGVTTKQPSRCARAASSVVVPSSSICGGAGHSALEPLSGEWPLLGCGGGMTGLCKREVQRHQRGCARGASSRACVRASIITFFSRLGGVHIDTEKGHVGERLLERAFPISPACSSWSKKKIISRSRLPARYRREADASLSRLSPSRSRAPHHLSRRQIGMLSRQIASPRARLVVCAPNRTI